MTSRSPAPASALERALARKVLETEAAAVLGLVSRLDDRFNRALDLLFACTGRVVVTGMGKSGIICRKIAATLSSTGTSAFFLHPAEAIHGDLGALRSDDVVMAVSHSGETAELLRLVEAIRRIGARLVVLTGAPDSALGQAADVTIDCGVAEEACPMNLVPTASTTAALAMGDALTMSLAVRRGFREDDFAHLHPGGRLGKRLMRVDHIMHGGEQMPAVAPDTAMSAVIHEMSAKRLGMTCVTDGAGRLLGVVTDGDLRRHLSPGIDLMALTARDVMTTSPATIGRAMLAVEALRILEERKITSLVVVDGNGLAEGVLHLHDLWRTQML
jgi:arabinose-5-phosphate isomerase